jgi:thioredoxin reductase
LHPPGTIMNLPNHPVRRETLDVAIVGAGPYGLSIAAHLRACGVNFRIFGQPMDSWLTQMPKGMLLKSDGFASNLYNPKGNFTLRQYCAENGIEYDDIRIPVRLETFAAYGLAFQERLVPEVEDKAVVAVDHSSDGFLLRLDDGERVAAHRVVLAVGITHFAHVPGELNHLPAEFMTHSSRHHDLEPFRGRSVCVVGGGASAIDLAGLLHELGVEVQLVARQPSLKFHGKPPADGLRSPWQRIRHPQSGIGPGLRSRFYTDAPIAFHYLPQGLRSEIVRTHLSPAGGWFAKDMVVGRVPILLGQTLGRAEIQEGRVRLHLRAVDGTEREIAADHVIAATGYRVDLGRLKFLSTELRAQLRAIESTPVLSSRFESSIAGLYFVGTAAANSFGPMMRFAFGAGFTARRVAKSLTGILSRERRSAAN